jgi:hydroxypyruvate isomerase
MPSHASFDRRRFFGASAAMAGAASLAAPLFAQTKQGEDDSSLGNTPHSRFAVNIEMWWSKAPFLDRIRNAAALGFPAVEFWPFQNKDIDAIAQLSQELKIDIAQFTAWGFTPGMNHPENEDKFVATVEEACQVAHRLKCEKMCVVAGNNQPGMSQEEMHAQVIKALKRAAPIAEREKVMLILEPMNGRVDHPGHCLYGSEDAVRICREVNSPMIKINWDLYHMQIAEGDLCGHLKDGFDQVGYLQLADHPGRNEPGTGEIYYPRVLRQAHELGYRGYIGLELRPKTTELAAARGVADADVW